MTAPLIFLVIVVAIGFFLVSIYNRLVTYRNRYKNAFSQIDVQLKRRYDLIPNLVETAKGYLKHERETLEAVIQARNQAAGAAGRAAAHPGDAAAMAGLGSAEGAAQRRAGAAVRAGGELPGPQGQPDHGPADGGAGLHREPGRLRAAGFNDAVMQYNTAREVFPNSVLAGMFDFQPAGLFEVKNPAEKEAVRVKF